MLTNRLIVVLLRKRGPGLTSLHSSHWTWRVECLVGRDGRRLSKKIIFTKYSLRFIALTLWIVELEPLDTPTCTRTPHEHRQDLAVMQLCKEHKKRNKYWGKNCVENDKKIMPEYSLKLHNYCLQPGGGRWQNSLHQWITRSCAWNG